MKSLISHRHNYFSHTFSSVDWTRIRKINWCISDNSETIYNQATHCHVMSLILRFGWFSNYMWSIPFDDISTGTRIKKAVSTTSSENNCFGNALICAVSCLGEAEYLGSLPLTSLLVTWERVKHTMQIANISTHLEPRAWIVSKLQSLHNENISLFFCLFKNRSSLFSFRKSRILNSSHCFKFECRFHCQKNTFYFNPFRSR